MMPRYLTAALAALVLASAARAVEPADLKPGLVATYQDFTSGEEPPKVVRLEPTVALALGDGHSPHPRLATGFDTAWKGYINITRAGKYTFGGVSEGGKLEVLVNGKPALDATLTLEGGVVPFEARFRRTAGPVRVELTWEGPGFIKEPLAYQFLGHLAKDRPKQFDTDGALEHGRFKFEELACAKCHKPAANDAMAKTLAPRTGPNLTDVAKRAYAGWIYAWLADPAKLRPNTAMPKSFASDDTGTAERYAVTQYLVSLAGKPLDVYKLPTVPPNPLKQSMDRGRVLFHVTGCAACHTEPAPNKKKDEDDEREPLAPADYLFGQHTATGPVAKYAHGGIGSKFRPETLATFLQNPTKTNPHGRMPNLNLNGAEATDLANYLVRTVDENVIDGALPVPKLKPSDLATADEKKTFEKLKPEQQWAALGGRLVVSKGCANCHAIEPGGKPVAASEKFPALNAVKKAGATGCISEKPDASKVPVYKLSDSERAALAAFVKDGLTGAGASAPAYQARVALKRFNCLNCHQRDGEGGIPVSLADTMRQMEKAENADDVRPPVLTGVAHKTRTSWLKTILTQSGRARPWMQLRMPQYGEANVGFLPEALTALEGTTPDDKVHVVERTATKVAAGRALVGKGGLGCVSCHDIGGFANTGTRGPDLATINQRVRYDWYERWLSQPLRMAPGTRMPQAFVEGKSVLKTIFNGDPKQQAEAMWAYLALGPGLPLPDGLEPPKGLVIAVKDRAEVLRTFLPDAGSKAIAVGYPGYVNVGFSADQCRTSYAWAGNFLDASPVWNNRGGAPAKLLGQKFWTAPPGHPWGLTANAKLPPDFLGRANSPAFGTPLPVTDPPRQYDGPMAVQFEGYSLGKDGFPTFRYKLDETGKGAVLEVAETPAPLKALLATGLARKFDVTVPGEYQAWLLLGSSAKEPRAFDGTGKPLKIDFKADEVLVPHDRTRVVVPDGDRAALFDLSDAPAGTAWRLVQSRGVWLVMLKLPSAKEPKRYTFAANVLALPKDDDSLVKDLLTP